jgi:glycosyltransferase involved in cell wall biosynthesis
MKTITLSLTNYNRVGLLRESFAQVIDDDRISEIVISDDASDLTVYKAIQHEYKDIAKVKIHRNLSNVGVYQNKYRSALHATNDWVILFDSDNVLGKDYIDTLYNLPVLDWNPTVVHCPDFAKPKFDYRHFAGKIIDKENASKFFRQKQFDCLINTMNCFVNREEFLKVFDPNTEPSAADSAYFNYKWLMAGNSMLVVPGLQYEHRIHAGSHYVQNIASSNAFHSKMMDAFKYMK